MKDLGSESLPGTVLGNGDAPPVRMAVVSMRSRLSVEHKAVTHQRTDDHSGGEASQRCIIDRHRSDGDGDERLFKDLCRPFRRPVANRLAVFDHAGHDHFYSLLQVRKGFLARHTPSCAALPHERRAVGVPAVLVGL